MKKIVLALAVLAALFSCDTVVEKTGNVIDSGSQAVGKTATDIVNNIDKGISKGAAINIELSQDLTKKGVAFGKYYVRSGVENNSNVLSLYLITDDNFNGSLKAKLYDKKGVEMGRTSLKVTQKKGDAGYWDFTFDPKADIENQSKLTIE